MSAIAEDHKWQLQVTDRLSGVESRVDGLGLQVTAALERLIEQVTKQNGNVAKAMGRIADLEAKALARETAERAVKEATGPWKTWAERFTVVLLGVVMVLALFQAEKVLKIFTH